jgi:hypothetical protein
VTAILQPWIVSRWDLRQDNHGPSGGTDPVETVDNHEKASDAGASKLWPKRECEGPETKTFCPTLDASGFGGLTSPLLPLAQVVGSREQAILVDTFAVSRYWR